MKSAASLHSLDWSAIADEPLVLLARRHRWRSPVTELTRRYRGVLHCCVARQARACQWPRELLAEAQAEADVALLQAIARYDGAGHATCRFRTFLLRVVHDHLQDFQRHYWRDERHYDRSWTVADALELLESDAAEGPAAVAQRHETVQVLERVLGKLSDADWCLWEGLAAGQSLRQLAEELGLAYITARRRSEHLRETLHQRLQTMAEP